MIFTAMPERDRNGPRHETSRISTPPHLTAKRRSIGAQFARPVQMATHVGADANFARAGRHQVKVRDKLARCESDKAAFGVRETTTPVRPGQKALAKLDGSQSSKITVAVSRMKSAVRETSCPASANGLQTPLHTKHLARGV